MEQNLNFYKIFYEAAKYGNISKAADNLFISQPAVSKSITKLEQSLNHTLFLRSKKGVRLTEEGKTLYHYLEKAFDSIETAESTLKRMGELGIGQLRIGASTSLCKHILLPYLQDFIRENPHVKISIACNPTFETLQMLKQGKIDIGLICDTPLERPFHFMPLRSIHDTFVSTQTYLDNLTLREQNTVSEVITDDHYPESRSDDATAGEEGSFSIPNVAGLFMFSERTVPQRKGKTLTTKEILEKSNLMLLDQGNISRMYIDQYFEENHIYPGQVLEINNMDLLIDFAAIGMGVACVVKEFVSSYIESGQVMEIPLEKKIAERTVGFVYDEHSLNTTPKKFMEFTDKYLF